MRICLEPRHRLGWLMIAAWGAVGWWGGGIAHAQDEAPAVVETIEAAAEVVPFVPDTGDTAWVLTSAAIVLMMTIPGLSFFYGGLVRRKNVLSVLMQCFAMACLISVLWLVYGYSEALGPTVGGFVGNLDWAFFNGVTAAEANGDYAGTIPHQLFAMFQLMFAIITPALIVGALAERVRFVPLCIAMILWATLVYNPICHWVWAGNVAEGRAGFIKVWGALDFAGGTVVHINAGMAALAGALVLGKRRGFPKAVSPPHNLPFAVMGAGLLWVGWFGFNAGSALGAGSLAASAFLNTHMAAAAAGLVWALMDLWVNRHVTNLGIITGAVAGLVAITPAAGFVSPCGALVIGALAGFIPFLSVTYMKPMFGYDDTLDAFGVHGIGGIVGAVATGFFATTTINAGGADGLFYGNPALVWTQIKAVVVVMIYSFVLSYVIFKVVDVLMGLRAKEDEERIGLDLTQHREAGYTLVVD